MSTRVRTAFRPLETTASFDAKESVELRRAATSVPSMYYGSNDACAPERLQLLSRLEQRWCSFQPLKTCSKRSDCVAPVPRRQYSYSSSDSRPTSSGSLVEDDLACMELRGIFGHGDAAAASASRSSSASSSSTFTGPGVSMDHEMGLFPLEEIIVRAPSPISRSGNPMPLDAGFGAAF
ncbi:hypothetical protein H4R20_000234 [Coemansia guatemalensis]|uniref:Uncharacterized protein n=1 Tax=Coemansia guatemalensis TaxID=2761395 RepID=A0A9W8LW42_9FUNG|nr:hypothetical protein H4R20_000234 [Coemansia guatemalensis]